MASLAHPDVPVSVDPCGSPDLRSEMTDPWPRMGCAASLSRLRLEDWAVPQRRFPISGEVDISSTEELQKSLLELVNATNDDLVIDCDGLEFIDSTGVAALMHTRQLLEIQNRGFRVENLHGMPRRTFDVLGLTDLLELPAAESA